jgi:hypothetical protein
LPVKRVELNHNIQSVACQHGSPFIRLRRIHGSWFTAKLSAITSALTAFPGISIMIPFVNKRLDLLAKYFADLSKILFSAVIVKQFIGAGFDALELVLGSFAALVFIVGAVLIQPKE